MTVPKPSILDTALSLWSIGLVLKEIGLGLLVFALSIMWIRVPDASVLEVVASVLLGFVIVAIGGAGESAMILRLCDRPRTPGRLVVGTLLLLAGIALWLECSAWIDHLAVSRYQLAGYLNSRLPHELRYFFSYSHIVLWLGWIETVATWVVAGILSLVVVAFTASARPVRAMLIALRSVSYWTVVIVGLTASAVLTSAILSWVPGQTLRVEMMSLLFRLIVVVFVDAAVACLVITTVAACVRYSDVPYATSAGIPEESHERTTDIP